MSFFVFLLVIYVTVVDQLPRELICLLLFTCNYVVSVGKVSSSERFPLLDAWDGLRYFIVALPEPSI